MSYILQNKKKYIDFICICLLSIILVYVYRCVSWYLGIIIQPNMVKSGWFELIPFLPGEYEIQPPTNIYITSLFSSTYSIFEISMFSLPILIYVIFGKKVFQYYMLNWSIIITISLLIYLLVPCYAYSEQKSLYDEIYNGTYPKTNWNWSAFPSMHNMINIVPLVHFVIFYMYHEFKFNSRGKLYVVIFISLFVLKWIINYLRFILKYDYIIMPVNIFDNNLYFTTSTIFDIFEYLAFILVTMYFLEDDTYFNTHIFERKKKDNGRNWFMIGLIILLSWQCIMTWLASWWIVHIHYAVDGIISLMISCIVIWATHYIFFVKHDFKHFNIKIPNKINNLFNKIKYIVSPIILIGFPILFSLVTVGSFLYV